MERLANRQPQAGPHGRVWASAQCAYTSPWGNARKPLHGALLAPIDAGFTAGFDTAALQKAKALLETLAG